MVVKGHRIAIVCPPSPIILHDVGIHLTQVTTISCGQARSVLAELTIDM